MNWEQRCKDMRSGTSRINLLTVAFDKRCLTRLIMSVVSSYSFKSSLISLSTSKDNTVILYAVFKIQFYQFWDLCNILSLIYDSEKRFVIKLRLEISSDI